MQTSRRTPAIRATVFFGFTNDVGEIAFPPRRFVVAVRKSDLDQRRRPDRVLFVRVAPIIRSSLKIATHNFIYFFFFCYGVYRRFLKKCAHVFFSQYKTTTNRVLN